MDAYQRYLERKRRKPNRNRKRVNRLPSTPLIDAGEAIISALITLKADLKRTNAPLLERLDIHKNS